MKVTLTDAMDLLLDECEGLTAEIARLEFSIERIKKSRIDHHEHTKEKHLELKALKRKLEIKGYIHNKVSSMSRTTMQILVREIKESGLDDGRLFDKHDVLIKMIEAGIISLFTYPKLTTNFSYLNSYNPNLRLNFSVVSNFDLFVKAVSQFELNTAQVA